MSAIWGSPDGAGSYNGAMPHGFSCRRGLRPPISWLRFRRNSPLAGARLFGIN